METVKWKVEGMTCANCALTINKYLDKKGMQNIRVNPIDACNRPTTRLNIKTTFFLQSTQQITFLPSIHFSSDVAYVGKLDTYPLVNESLDTVISLSACIYCGNIFFW
jgi:copper chaperone CopZ